jgi:hypothetical protein
LEIKQLTDHIRPYHHSNNIAENQDTGLAYSILQEEGEKPGLITSKKALDEYDNEIEEYIDNSLNFARILSSNKFQDKQLGFVTGMRNYGDEYVFKWGSYLGKSVQVDRSGNETEYHFGEESFNIFPLYRNLTLQDVFRFGRNEEPATVYVNTSGLPDWVPVEKDSLPTPFRSERQVMKFLSECGAKGANTNEITENTDITKRNAQRIVNKLEKKGRIEKHTFDSFPVYTLND